MPFPSSQPAASTATHSPIPALDLTRQYETIKDEIREAIDRVLKSQHFIGGRELEQFEAEAARYLEVDAVVGCASGTDALWLALQAAGVGAGDAVVTTPFSFFASASSIARCGAKPIFADIDAETLNLSAHSLEQVLRAHQQDCIKAVLPVHLYGQCAAMDAIKSAAEKFGIAVIEDAAQAFGARWQDRPAGSLGKVAAFSFYPTKNLAAYGEAGCVTTNDPEIAEHVRRLRNHGSRERYHHEEFGWNSRLDALQAAVLRVKLQHLDEWNEQRRSIAHRYNELLHRAGLISSAMTDSGGKCPVRVLGVSSKASHIYHQYVVRAVRRDELRVFLREQEIGTEIYYPLPLHLQPAFAYLGYQKGTFPEAERASSEVIALPLFPELREDEQRRIVAAIADFYS